MDVIVKDNRPSVFDAFVFFFFFPNWVPREGEAWQTAAPPVLEDERVGTKPPPWRKNAASSSNQSMEATFFIHNWPENGILQPMDQQHPPVHHPLDACYYSVVGGG
jgi:hypothetical protein